MRLLLDTHIVIWFLRGSAKMPRAAMGMMDAAETVYVSSASVWEASIKISLGKLELDTENFEADLLAAGFEHLPITWEHAAKVRQLPLHHSDPFDRLLIAQALCEPLRLVTSDKVLGQYSDLVTVV